MLATLTLGLLFGTAPAIDVNVDGEGYLRFVRDGRAVYAKQAKLTEKGGKLCNIAGDPTLPTIALPSNLQGLEVDLEGNVYAVRAGSRSKTGRLVLALFANNAALSPEAGVMISSERPKLGNPGEDKRSYAQRLEVFNLYRARSEDGQTCQPVEQKIGGSVEISVLPEAEVAGDKILLGEIATIEASEKMAEQLKAVEIGDTPAFGIKRIIDRVRVIARLKAAGFKPENFVIVVPAKVEVRRQAQIVPHQQFVDIALAAVNAQSGADLGYQSNDIYPDFSAPMGELILKVESVSGLNTVNVSATVSVYVDSKKIASRTVKLKSAAPAVAIKIGSPVNVIFKTGGVQLQVQGIAKSSAGIGKSIQVEVKTGTPEVKTIHSGTVIAAGLIEVKL